MDAKSNSGWTALMWATINSHLEVAKLLVENGADITAKDNQGTSVCDYARMHESSGIADFFDSLKNTDRTINTGKKALERLRRDIAEKRVKR